MCPHAGLLYDGLKLILRPVAFDIPSISWTLAARATQARLVHGSKAGACGPGPGSVLDRAKASLFLQNLKRDMVRLQHLALWTSPAAGQVLHAGHAKDGCRFASA